MIGKGTPRALLAALLVPLVSGWVSPAEDGQATDLCVQVAEAWINLAIQAKRFPDGAHDAIVEAFKTDAGTADGVHFGHGIVCAVLDANNDGILAVPGNLIGQSEDVELRTGAAAWVWDKKRKKVFHSWTDPEKSK